MSDIVAVKSNLTARCPDEHQLKTFIHETLSNVKQKYGACHRDMHRSTNITIKKHTAGKD